MIGTALRLYALADSYLGEQLGERLRPTHLEQGDEGAPVAATYTTISDVPDEGLTEDGNHATKRMQFDVFANDEELADTVAGRLRKRLRSAHGNLQIDESTSVFCTGCSTASGVRDLSAIAPTDGSQQWKHRLSFDMMVSHNTD